MTYLLLGIAIALEICASTLLDLSRGFSNPVAGVAALACYAVSLAVFSRVLVVINLSVAYATWCAVGIVATTLISVFFLHEGIRPAGVVGVALLVVGVIVVNLSSTPSP